MRLSRVAGPSARTLSIPPYNGDIYIDIKDCDTASAQFLDDFGRAVCRISFCSSHPLLVDVRPGVVDVPLRTPEAPTFRLFFNTVANDPASVPGAPADGVATIIGRDLSNNQEFNAITIEVSNNCQ
jgi:hypothetical protein